MSDKLFWMTVRQALLSIVAAIEEMGEREGWYQSLKTADARRIAKNETKRIAKNDLR